MSESELIVIVCNCQAVGFFFTSYWLMKQPYPGCQRFFFSLGATELSGEAAKSSREAARKKPLAPTDNNLTSMPTPISFD